MPQPPSASSFSSSPGELGHLCCPLGCRSCLRTATFFSAKQPGSNSFLPRVPLVLGSVVCRSAAAAPGSRFRGSFSLNTKPRQIWQLLLGCVRLPGVRSRCFASGGVDTFLD